MNLINPNDIPVACDLTAIDAGQRDDHRALSERVYGEAVEIVELGDGVALRYPADGDLFVELARFVTLERQCCPFFTFGLEMAGPDGPVWLRLTGGERVKDFLLGMFADRAKDKTR